MEKKMSLKLLVNMGSQKVLVAETGKDFVDFLSNLLQLPLGSVTRLLDKSSMVGCLGNLYQSVENLDDSYFQSGLHKKMILNPTSSCVFDGNSTSLFLKTDSTRRYYRCGNVSGSSGNGLTPVFGASSVPVNCNGDKYVTDVRCAACPKCKRQMTTELIYVGDKEKQGCDAREGYVKGFATYMVMDDLAIAPMSTISSITLLNKFNIQDVGFLEERMVEVGMDEGLAILKQSLQSKTVLTDVFLGKKAACRAEERGVQEGRPVEDSPSPIFVSWPADRPTDNVMNELLSQVVKSQVWQKEKAKLSQQFGDLAYKVEVLSLEIAKAKQSDLPMILNLEGQLIKQPPWFG